MMSQERTIHEPEAELLSAEDAIKDAERLSTLFPKRRHVEQAVALQVQISVLLEAIDRLDLEALHTVARRTEERLAAANERS